jgi:hypothetical protein
VSVEQDCREASVAAQRLPPFSRLSSTVLQCPCTGLRWRSGMCEVNEVVAAVPRQFSCAVPTGATTPGYRTSGTRVAVTRRCCTGCCPTSRCIHPLPLS